MYHMTGLPGWMRFGFSPGWVGRSPSGLPPAAQYLMQTEQTQQFMDFMGAPQTPLYQGSPMSTQPMTKEQEIVMLEDQMEMIEQQLEQIKKRLDELKT